MLCLEKSTLKSFKERVKFFARLGLALKSLAMVESSKPLKCFLSFLYCSDFFRGTRFFLIEICSAIVFDTRRVLLKYFYY